MTLPTCPLRLRFTWRCQRTNLQRILSEALRLAIKNAQHIYVGQSFRMIKNNSQCTQPFQAGGEVYHKSRDLGILARKR